LYFSFASGDLEIRMFTMNSSGLEIIEQSQREIPVTDSADVVVAGGGIAGVAAALCAAEKGLSVILLESRNYLGQEFTATCKCYTKSLQTRSSARFAGKIYRELEKEGIFAGE